MAARSIKPDGPAIVVLMYEDDTSITISGVTKISESPDGTLEIIHDDRVTKVRPTYRLYEIKPDTGEEDDD